MISAVPSTIDCADGQFCSYLDLQPGEAKCCGKARVFCNPSHVLEKQDCGLLKSCVGHGNGGAQCEGSAA